MKKLLIALTLCGMLLCSGCSVFFPAPVAEPEAPAPSPYLHKFEQAWCYQRLSEPLRVCYAAIYDAIMENRYADTVVTVSNEDTDNPMEGEETTFPGIRVNLPYHIDNERDAKLLYQAITWDNPQFFFLSNDYYYEGYRNTKTGSIVCRSLCLPFTLSAAERRDAAYRLDEAVAAYTRDLPRGDEFEIELALHDRMLENCTYHTEAGASHDYTRYPNAFTVIGALVDGQAVCEGYSRGMQLLLQEAGIASSLVTGINENNEPHMWNLVTVNGRNYHLDPTWNDMDERVRHTFFNLSTASITRTHTIDADILGVDTCAATQDNYFHRTNRYINSFEREEIATVIARDMDAGESIIELQFDPPKFINGQLLVSNRELLLWLVREQQIAPDAVVWEDYEVLVNNTYYTILLHKK